MTLTDLHARLAARLNVGAWIGAERSEYADRKWDAGENGTKRVASVQDDPTAEWYLDYVRQYLHRAAVLGVDTPQGRQALGKATVTCLAALETVVLVYGPMPQPAVSSGEIREWKR